MNSDRKRTPKYITFALILNTVALALSLVVYRPFFETNDDAVFCLIAEGVHGVREPHIISADTILGRIYMFLYGIISGIRWHSVLQYLFMFVGYTALAYLIQVISDPKGEGGKCLMWGRIVAVLVSAMTFYESYVSLQFSKTGAIVCAAGCFILMYVLISGNRIPSRTLYFIAVILIIYGMLLRSASFKLVLLLLFPVGLYEIIAVFKREKRISKSLLGFVVTAVSLFALSVLFGRLNLISYDNDPAWKDFMAYHSAVVRLVDKRYDFLDQSKYADELDKLGVSANDSVMIMTWQFGDDNVWSRDELLKIAGKAPEKSFGIEDIKGLIQSIYDDVLIFNPCILGVLLLMIYSIYVYFKGRRFGKAAVIISQVVVISGIFVFYRYSGRWSHRIVFAALLVFLLGMVWMLAEDRGLLPVDEAQGDISGRGDDTGVITGMIVLVLTACIAVLLGNRFDYNDYKRSGTDYPGFYESISGDKETLYVADTFTFQDAYKYDVFKSYAMGSMDNFVTVGSWYLNSPITDKMLSAYGYDNPFDALVKGADTGNVILVDNMSANEKLTYLNEHYGGYELEELPQKFGFKMYRVVNAAK
ncbi:MAG: hypothetical protein IK111_00300 [Lachnospiraceae bacterium]|nr:hypothetical protein [Lachnospiraceae bacterium]